MEFHTQESHLRRTLYAGKFDLAHWIPRKWERALLQNIWACGAEGTEVCGCRNKGSVVNQCHQINSVILKEHYMQAHTLLLYSQTWRCRENNSMKHLRRQHVLVPLSISLTPAHRYLQNLLTIISKGDFYKGVFYFNLLQVPFLVSFYSWIWAKQRYWTAQVGVCWF